MSTYFFPFLEPMTLGYVLVTKSCYLYYVGLDLSCKFGSLLVEWWHEPLEPFWLVKHFGFMHVKEPKTPHDTHMHKMMDLGYDIMHAWDQSFYDIMHVRGQSLYAIIHVLRPICNMLVMWTPFTSNVTMFNLWFTFAIL